MGEHFCGHGQPHQEPKSGCYRGPGAKLWVDISCFHPSGHAALADLFRSVIEE